MADANTPEKNWWRWFEKDTLISIVSALGLDVIFEFVKKEGPQVAWTHFKKNLEEKVLVDKRAEMLREFRKMEDAGMKHRAVNLVDAILRVRRELAIGGIGGAAGQKENRAQQNSDKRP